MREGLAGILDRAGYDVDEAGDLDEALAVLDKGEVDALVVSFRLPPEGCRALLNACEAPPPTVVLNGAVEDLAGMVDDPRVRSVLTRPFPLRDLYEAVEKACT
jgi:DNA-binding response OmpR family regulator